MSQSTLDPDNLPAAPDRKLGKGHGTDALGPSDRSDTGSDVQGGPAAEEGLSDTDTDAEGTGERGAVGRERDEPGADIGTDHIETIPPEEEPLEDPAFTEAEVERALRQTHH